MAKKTLKEKIERVIWIFLTCTVAYIVCSLLLLNEYSRAAVFDAKKVYDVIKDALTLAASFLAPVAAFVLFRDWRESHVAIRDEALGIRIYEFITEVGGEIDRIDIMFRQKHAVIQEPVSVEEKLVEIKQKILSKTLLLQSQIISNEANDFRRAAELSLMNMLMFVNIINTLLKVKMDYKEQQNADDQKNTISVRLEDAYVRYKDSSLLRMTTFNELNDSLIAGLKKIKVESTD